MIYKTKESIIKPKKILNLNPKQTKLGFHLNPQKSVGRKVKYIY
jgi:hypothetical protein